MSDWSLHVLLTNLHSNIFNNLKTVRSSFGHPGTKGDGSENVWLDLFNTYLPKRYQAIKAHIVDSNGSFSDQIDIAIFDRQYSPFVFTYKGQNIIPIESVYAIFEVKQTVNKSVIDYTKNKISSVRKLLSTSLPIPHAGGEYPPKDPISIIGGILTFESEWTPALGDALKVSLEEGNTLDMGCIAAHGYFIKDGDTYSLINSDKAATVFLFQLISRLQSSGTVPMIDILAYSKWL